MRFLIVGLGSMGKRRIRCLRHLNAGDVVGYDPRADRRAEATERYGIETVDDCAGVLASRPDGVIISTPPDLHVRYAREAALRDLNFFMEASVVDDGMEELAEICRQRAIVAAPSCTMRFQQSIKKIRDLIHQGSVGRALCYTHHVGQYLPDWHPWEDYRKYYVSRRQTGGCREIVAFELEWLRWALGDVDAVSCFNGQVGTLEADIDDVYQVLLRHRNRTHGHLLVDVLSRTPYRTFRCVLEHGVIEFVWGERRVRVFDARTAAWTEFPESPAVAEPGYLASEDMYIEEMRAFLEAIAGRAPFPYRLSDDMQTLALLYEAERSAREGVHVAPQLRVPEPLKS